jgi:hypothetical protein
LAPEWAACGALLFAFSNYHLRWLVTLSFSQTWTLPPLLLLCASAARPAPAVTGNRRRAILLAAALGLWLGWGNPYFVFFAGCVIAGAFVLNFLRRAPWRRLTPLALLVATMGASVFVAHWAFFAAKLAGAGGTEQFDRGYTGAELYALKPLDLVVPPEDHRSHLLRDIGRIYASDTALKASRSTTTSASSASPASPCSPSSRSAVPPGPHRPAGCPMPHWQRSGAASSPPSAAAPRRSRWPASTGS